MAGCSKQRNIKWTTYFRILKNECSNISNFLQTVMEWRSIKYEDKFIFNMKVVISAVRERRNLCSEFNLMMILTMMTNFQFRQYLKMLRGVQYNLKYSKTLRRW